MPSNRKSPNPALTTQGLQGGLLGGVLAMPFIAMPIGVCQIVTLALGGLLLPDLGDVTLMVVGAVLGVAFVFVIGRALGRQSTIERSLLVGTAIVGAVPAMMLLVFWSGTDPAARPFAVAALFPYAAGSAALLLGFRLSRTESLTEPAFRADGE